MLKILQIRWYYVLNIEDSCSWTEAEISLAHKIHPVS